ncbi:MAG TPA: hypothetical protein VGP72_04925 [Planctomycetota bacterium]|jgi:hypothetical protein
MKYFDYEKVAREIGIPADKLALLCEIFRRDYPRDQMLFELHVLRACMAVRDGLTTLDAILKPEMAQHA